MTTVVRNLPKAYRKTAEEFARRVRSRLGARVHSIVLYGSVARGTASEESDIDILVLTEDDGSMKAPLAEIEEELLEENDYRRFVCSLMMTAPELDRMGRGGFPIAGHIMQEGVILSDDGTFARWREAGVASTTPGDEYIRTKLRQAEEMLMVARHLMEVSMYGSAADRAFYALLHSAETVLGLYGVEPGRTHSGVQSQFAERIVKTAIVEQRFSGYLEKARNLRITATYTGDPPITREQADETVRWAAELLDRVRAVVDDRGLI